VDDATLVRRMLRGEELAFDQFFAIYFPRLYRFTLARVDGPDVAEDLVQATMMKAVRNLHTWRGGATLFTWLCAIDRNEIASWRLRTGARQAVPLAEDAPEVRFRLATLAATVEQPDAALERRELARLVQVALDSLPPHYGDVLEWKYIEGLGVADIATRLRSSPKAAESLLGRARRAFREIYAVLNPQASGSAR
jgi:RNA polymerase sigma-70 factor (ECF subfamily)